MTDTTANLNLVVTTDDDNRLFVVWRAGLDGVNDSNMTKIDAFSGSFVGGNKGQFLVKKSNDKFEFEWVNLSASDVFVDDATSIYDNYSVLEALEEIAGDLGNVNTILENVLGV